ncbi:TetR/AcrR family transcriptional regulator [Pseudomonas viridiflava]|uniref:TetR/AcrR family transcriptional regulator n=1 Tax=Pseudomonas viridiflava TaxID=33069 RepID=UPI000F059C6F|nr:TetR/AcrR family transcriptional regulator [Pseudomonas viridiflava]
MAPTNTRARSAEQKQEKRRLLLSTAREVLLDNTASLDLGINELARRAQMTKSNVYRYFESSEAVLMDLLVEEYEGWHADLMAELESAATTAPDIEHVAELFASTVSARPLLCRLTSIMPSILERNVSFERMVEFKRQLILVRQGTAQAFNSYAPMLPASAYEQVIRLALPLIIGLWPLSNPAEVAARVVEHPGLETLKYNFMADFESSLLMIMRGMGQAKASGG